MLRARGRWVVWLVVLAGLAVRAYHYLRGRPVWHDEAALILSVLDLDFAGLLGPLHFHEAAPPLFLWLTKAASLLLGDGPLALRLVPFLASCACVVLLVPLARRALPEGATPWAVLVLAVSGTMAWHASEAKPYAVDALVGAVVIALYLGLRGDGGPSAGQLLPLAGLAPLLVWLSYPACFLLGGLLLTLLPAAARSGWAVRAAYALVGVAVAGAFVALVLGPVRAQHDTVIHSDWVARFMPDWRDPLGVPGWAALRTAEVFRYNCDPTGGFLLPLALLGAAALARSGRGDLAFLLLAPLGLALLAACLHRYPYGGARVVTFAAPAVALLLGAGASAAWSALAALSTPRRRAALAVPLLALLLWPAASCLRQVVVPWPAADVPGAAAFVARHREGGERVAGNDWTHGYYFRHLGPLFSWCGSARPGPGEDGLWVVWTQAGVTHRHRLEAARAHLPAGWRLDRDADFFATSVAHFVRASEQNARR